MVTLETKSFVGEVLDWLRDIFLRQTITLNRFEYIHVQDKETGKVTLHEGPIKLRLKTHHHILEGIREKVRVSDGQFAIILNPFDAAHGDIAEGEREVRIGPAVFALYPGEELKEGKLHDEYLLNDDDGLVVHALKEAPHPLDPTQTLAPGVEVLLRGPRRYIPHKDIHIDDFSFIKSISLAENEGVYLQNTETGEVHVVTGPREFFVEPHEKLWDKPLTKEELQALGYEPQENTKDIRMLSSTPRTRHHLSDAVAISLEGNEAIYLYDGENVRVLFGPKTVFLEPNERPKVLFISGSVPIKPNQLRIAKLSLGPDLIRDSIIVRTRDNATLGLDVTYRWRFQVDLAAPERLFALKDFVGFVAQTLSAEIRGEAARHDFERFHAEAGILITQAIFADQKERLFAENGLIIFGVDVERITPKEDQISERLSEALLTNVDIQMETAREKAELAREQELIAERVRNEESRQELLELEATNKRQQQLASAELEREVAMLRAQSEADSRRVRNQVELEAETERLRLLQDILQTPGGEAYIRLEQARSIKATDKMIVPSNANLYLGADFNLTTTKS